MTPLLARRFDRRTLLAGAGSAFAASLLRSVTGHAQAAPPRRLVVWYSPCGTLEREFRPRGTETDFAFGRILAPIERRNPRLKSKMLMFGPSGPESPAHGVRTERGISIKINPNRPEPSTLGHGCHTLLTAATPTVSGDAHYAAGPSVDQFIVERLAPATRFRSLQLGVAAWGRLPQDGNLIWRAAREPVPVENDPAAAFARIFTGVMVDDAGRRRVARRASVLDAVHRNFDHVRGVIGRADQARLDAHLASVREVERRLQDLSAAAACAPPALPAAIDRVEWNRHDAIPQHMALQTDILVSALQCGLTRVASLQYGSAAANLAAPWLGINDLIHGLSHREVIVPGMTDPFRTVADQAAADERFVRYSEWLMDQLGRFLDALERTPEGDGTMLDNTLVLVVNELSDGYYHTHQNMPFFLAGNVANHFRTGRYVTFADKSHNDLLVSVCRAMGVDVTTFGDPAACTGPLPGLTR